jgi:hypothetical protein
MKTTESFIMITEKNKRLLEITYDSILKECTSAVQKRILTNPLESNEYKIYFSKNELMVQQYDGLWLHSCHIPGKIWRESWDATLNHINDPTNWSRSLFQCNMKRVSSFIHQWHHMPEGIEKNQLLDRFVRDSCIVTPLGYRFACDSSESIPNDMLNKIQQLGFVT